MRQVLLCPSAVVYIDSTVLLWVLLLGYLTAVSRGQSLYINVYTMDTTALSVFMIANIPTPYSNIICNTSQFLICINSRNLPTWFLPMLSDYHVISYCNLGPQIGWRLDSLVVAAILIYLWILSLRAWVQFTMCAYFECDMWHCGSRRGRRCVDFHRSHWKCPFLNGFDCFQWLWWRSTQRRSLRIATLYWF